MFARRRNERDRPDQARKPRRSDLPGTPGVSKPRADPAAGLVPNGSGHLPPRSEIRGGNRQTKRQHGQERGPEPAHGDQSRHGHPHAVMKQSRTRCLRPRSGLREHLPDEVACQTIIGFVHGIPSLGRGRDGPLCLQPSLARGREQG